MIDGRQSRILGWVVIVAAASLTLHVLTPERATITYPWPSSTPLFLQLWRDPSSLVAPLAVGVGAVVAGAGVEHVRS